MNALALTLVLHTSLLASAPSYADALQDAKTNNRPLVVLVGADWCPGCISMKHSTIPTLQRNGKLSDVAFTMVNTDSEPELARKLMRGGSIPQLIVFSNTAQGWKRLQLTGAQSTSSVESLIEQARQMQVSETHPVSTLIGAE